MITVIKDVPENVVAFHAEGEVTKENYEEVVTPAVEALIKKTGMLNYVMFIDTDISNFTAAAALKDAMLGISKLGKWHKGAIVSDSTVAKAVTGMFNFMSSADFKSFDKDELQKAIQWVSE